MTENLSALYLYLEKENLLIDREEYQLQMQSHPDYPSLLSISDTLDFFNIENFAAKVDHDEIENLPDSFMAVLKTDSNWLLYHIERIGDDFFCSNGKKKFSINAHDFLTLWNGIVLIAQSQGLHETAAAKKNYTGKILFLFSAGLLVFLVLMSHASIAEKLFLLFPALGLLFSFAALKDFFGTNNEFLSKFCNIAPSADCTSVIGSSKWKIFEIVNFTDLSILFFNVQLIGLSFFLLAGSTASYFTVFKILLFASIPVIALSAYYQKFIEKKMCPICLAIISIIILEIAYVSLFIDVTLLAPVKDTAILLLLSAFAGLGWFTLKRILTDRKELRDSALEGKRFMRNYRVFKNSLLASDTVSHDFLLSNGFIAGNENADLKITVVTNPFCGHCASAHNYIEQILEKHGESICIDIRFNCKTEGNRKDNDIYKVHQKLVQAYFEKGPEAFIESLHDWFKYKDSKKIVAGDGISTSNREIDEILENQFLLNTSNNISFTPVILIDKFQFPRTYDRKDLIHFINDLIEDPEIYLRDSVK